MASIPPKKYEDNPSDDDEEDPEKESSPHDVELHLFFTSTQAAQC
ncbi:hypothetical protein MPER_14611 [Moniliophthora perniciosa FA553]|nr:hypothetical protein MPER_14611 [Moniliophthora perniciosa FA553]